MQVTEARQVLWHEAVLATGAVTGKEGVVLAEVVVDAKCTLIRVVLLVADAEIIVGVVARTDDGRLAHHGHPTHHAHHQVGRRRKAAKHLHGYWAESAGRNDVVRKRLARELRVLLADRK